ncbi:MAG: DUF2934 domain-containing protein [Deltaproteobacteria bacterium]
MLHSARSLKGYRIEAQDGEIGTAVNFYFEDREWVIRFLVCDTSARFGRDVLIPPLALENKPLSCDRTLRIVATIEMIKNSPQVNTRRPVSSQQQHILDRYYSWHLSTIPELNEQVFEGPFAAANLHSALDIAGYHLKTRDGEIAAVEDFIIDDQGWTVAFLVLQAGLWLPGKRFLLDPHWVDEIDWPEKRLNADVSADKIRTSPDYDPSMVITPELACTVHQHFGQPKFSTQKALEEIIRRKAQELYSKRGAAPGNDWADWFEAERLVKEELNRLIREKAHELSSQKGGKQGWQDWSEAERLVREELKKKR